MKTAHQPRAMATAEQLAQNNKLPHIVRLIPVLMEDNRLYHLWRLLDARGSQEDLYAYCCRLAWEVCDAWPDELPDDSCQLVLLALEMAYESVGEYLRKQTSEPRPLTMMSLSQD